MEPPEVIDLSSDEEKSPPKKQDAKSAVPLKRKADAMPNDNDTDCMDVEILYNVVKQEKENLKNTDGASSNKKQKLCREKNDNDLMTNLVNDKEITIQKLRRIKPIKVSPQSESKLPKSESLETKNNHHNSPRMKTNGTMNIKRSLFRINEGASSSTQMAKPQLLVKKKVQISETAENSMTPSREVFASFLDVCRHKDPSGDMKKIVAKLEKRYNNLHPIYSKSGSFIQLIRQKTAAIENQASKIFVHIAAVMDEMKARQIGSNKDDRDVPETSSLDREDLEPADSRENERLRALERAMRRCERRIQKCEMAEVDFDDENDSYYILTEKYKQRMVDLYNKYCEITGEKPDAGRAYLRPKHLSVTPLQPLNDAITSFINMKITKISKSLVDKKKKHGRLLFTDALIFPDYVDILNCIKKCNEKHDLKLSKTREESIAKTAFGDLGQVLQRYRKQDYWETISSFLDKEDDDPALEDPILAEKLSRNEVIGKKKLDEVFQEYVEKQFAAKPTENEGELENDDQKTDVASSEGSDNEDSDDAYETNDANSDSNESGILDISLQLEDDSDEKINDDAGCHDGRNSPCPEPAVVNPDKSAETTPLPSPIEKPVSENKVADTTENPLQSSPVSKVPPEVEPDLDSSAETLLLSPSKTLVSASPKVDNIGDSPKMTSPPSLVRKTTCTNEMTDHSYVAKDVPLSSPAQEPTTTVVTCEENSTQAAKTPPTSPTTKANEGSSKTPADDTKAINVRDAPVVELSDEEETKPPILRLRQFAKPPGSWKDFQSPTKSTITESKTVGIVNAHTEGCIPDQVKPINLAKTKIIQLNVPNPKGRTIQVSRDILTNLKNKSSTIIIPQHLHGSNRQINVNTITNNVTVNLTNPAQFNIKSKSVVPSGTKPLHSHVTVDQSGKISTHGGSVGLISIGNPKQKVSNVPIRKVESRRQQVCTVKNPSNQVRQVAQRSSGVDITQNRIKIISQKSVESPLDTVRDIPVLTEDGTKKIYRIIKRSPGATNRSVVHPTKASVVKNLFVQGKIEGPKCSTSMAGSPNSNINSVGNKSSSKIPRQYGHTKVNKVYEKSGDDVPTVVID